MGASLDGRSRERVRRCIDRGVGFLLANQDPDGLWRDFHTPAGAGSLWPTGFIGHGLRSIESASNALERAADALSLRQNDDGGWGYNETVPTDADSTAWALMFLSEIGGHEIVGRRAVSCLERHQLSDTGGVATYAAPGPIRRFMGVGRWMPFWGWCRPHTEVTAVAARALLAFRAHDHDDHHHHDHDHDHHDHHHHHDHDHHDHDDHHHDHDDHDHHHDAVDAAWQYVRSQQRESGRWSSYWWTSPHYGTAQATALAAARGDHQAARRAAAWVGGSAADFAFATAMSLSILVSADAASARITDAADALVEAQANNGGWAGAPILRIPVPADADPDREDPRRIVRFAGGIDVEDQYGLFTTGACVAALAGSVPT